MIRSLKENLEEFRVRFNSTKVLVNEDNLIYIYPSFSRNVNKMCSEANLLIDRLGLPLVAIHSVNNSYFTVQSNEWE